MYLRAILHYFPVTLLALGVLACTKPQPPTTELNQAPAYRTTPRNLVHSIRYPGETLSLISHWYTGNPANWPKIAKANTKIKPNRLRSGERIIIPATLVVRTESMPPGFLAPQSRSKLLAASPSFKKQPVVRAPKQLSEAKLARAKLSAPKPSAKNSRSTSARLNQETSRSFVPETPGFESGGQTADATASETTAFIIPQSPRIKQRFYSCAGDSCAVHQFD